MQNSKCKMQNFGGREADIFLIISEGNTFILHSAFSILHSTGRSHKLQFPHNNTGEKRYETSNHSCAGDHGKPWPGL